MTDYISRDAVIENILSLSIYDSFDEIKNKIEKARYRENEWIGGIHDALLACEEVPSADVREVVRCKDCKYRDVGNGVPKMVYCQNISGGWVSEDFYCAYGSRMDGEEK